MKTCFRLVTMGLVLLFLGARVSTGAPEEETSAKSQRQSFADFKKSRTAKFEAFQKEFEEYKKIVREETGKVEAEVGEHWDEPELSSEKIWVEYSKTLDERRTVDFEEQTITIEVNSEDGAALDNEAVREKLTEIVTKNAAEAFEDDRVAQAIEKRSKQEIELLETAEVPPESMLYSYLTGFSRADSDAADSVREIVDHMMESLETSTSTNEKGEPIKKIEVPLKAPDAVVAKVEKQAIAAHKTTPKQGGVPPSALPARAKAIWSDVDNRSKQAKIDMALVYAVIETESAFDPRATSHIPAYGLMQIVPGSAGKDVTKELHGEARILAPSYLYVSTNNIEAGATYLKLLYHKYFKDVTDPTSRLYCAVAAYNTGPGNLNNAFTEGHEMRFSRAIPEINKLTSDQVYAHLQKNLEYDEAKHYLEKVTRLIAKYEGYGV